MKNKTYNKIMVFGFILFLLLLPFEMKAFALTFGDTAEASQFPIYSAGTGTERIIGIHASPTNDGTVDNITIKTGQIGAGSFVWQCGLYVYSGVRDAGALIASTETKTFTGSEDNSVIVFNFSSPPSVTASTDYFLTVHFVTDTSAGANHYIKCSAYASGIDDNFGVDVCGSPPSPITGEADVNRDFYIYASYTESGANNAPTFAGASPVNESTGISITPNIYIIPSDADSDTMTCDWYTSTDGSSWTWRQTNNTVSSGTNISYSYTQASGYNTKYYWKCTANDGTDNTTSEFYEFTTESAAYENTAPVSSNPSPVNDSSSQSVSIGSFTIDINDADGNNTWGNFTMIPDKISSGSSWSNQASGTRTAILNTLDYSTEYKMWVNFSDTYGDNVYDYFTFTTEGENNFPSTSTYSPLNNSASISITLSNLSIYIYDVDGDLFNWTIELSDNQNSSANDSLNGTKTLNFSSYLLFNTTYTWFINVTDGNSSISLWYNFTTAAEGVTNSSNIITGRKGYSMGMVVAMGSIFLFISIIIKKKKKR